VPLLMLLDLAASLLSARACAAAALDEIGWLVPFILAGMAVGLTLLIEVAGAPLLACWARSCCYRGYGLRAAAARRARARLVRPDRLAAARSRRCSAPAACCSRSTTPAGIARQASCARPTRR
jgi:hypothetical protein